METKYNTKMCTCNRKRNPRTKNVYITKVKTNTN